MMKPLLVLVLLTVAAASGAADAPSGAPAKKRAKASGQSPAAQAGARVERKKTGFERTGEGLSQSGGGDISGGGEAVVGAGVSRGPADRRAGANPGAGSSGGGGGGGGGSSSRAPSKSFAKAKVSVSVSPSGPWVQNGEVCNTGAVYSRTTGLDRTKPPKGCASPFDSKDCLDFTKHRDFLPNEWVDPFTIQTVVNGPDYPAGKYAMYLGYSKSDIKQVGYATLKTCAAPARTCRWTSPDAVIGPCNGPGCNNPPCSTANQGAQGMGGGGLWTCTCN
jgi:hypothetical protein